MAHESFFIFLSDKTPKTVFPQLINASLKRLFPNGSLGRRHKSGAPEWWFLEKAGERYK
jgi:hypothetical protein